MSDEAIRLNGDKFSMYEDESARTKAADWLQRNLSRVAALFENVDLRDFVFEPFKSVFDVPGAGKEAQIKTTITLIALVNMVLAGLPGKMGVGVFVSMALEAFMAYRIALAVGIKLDGVSDVWKYLSLAGSAGLTIVYGFKALLGLSFSLFSVVPGINPLIFAELLTTNLFGILIWTGFEEARKSGSFSVPRRMLLSVWKQAKELFKFQFNTLKNTVSAKNIKTVGSRVKDWVTGSIVDEAKVRGELLVPLAFFYLKGREVEKLNGPVGQEFIGAIRDRFPELHDASIEDIADAMEQYQINPENGVFPMLKGKLFERLVARAENTDGDDTYMRLHDDESHPGSDAILWSSDTRQELEISIKGSADPDYLEGALSLYPNHPIITTLNHEADDQIIPMLMTNVELEGVTQENFDALFSRLDHVSSAGMGGASAGSGAIAALWPFTVAYLRKRITRDQLDRAFKKVLGDSGVALGSRVGWGLVLGPIFAWFILAKGVMQIAKTQMPEGEGEIEPDRVKVQITLGLN